jgi:hypothetical protein
MIQDFAMKIGNMNSDVVAGALARSTMRLQGPQYMVPGMGDSGACVLPNFSIRVDGKTVTIESLYDNFSNDTTHLIESANWACTQKDQKKIDKVTCREYKGDIIKFTDGDLVLECTPDHLVPVYRDRKRIVILADEIKETDKLIGL